MITENLSTLKIHKLTQAQYDRELDAGRIDENALYLTPDEEIDLSPYATIEQLNEKADSVHDHNDVYYTEAEVDNILSDLVGDKPVSEQINTAIDKTAGRKVNGGEIFNDYDTNVASGPFAHAEGWGTKATNNSSHAEGRLSQATGVQSHAEGHNTLASGTVSHAEGKSTVASGENSHAEGYASQATADYAHAEGYNTRASGIRSHAEGQNSEAIGEAGHAEGIGTKAYAGHAEGQFSESYGGASHAEGNKTKAMHYAGHSEGAYSVAEGGAAHAEGGHYKRFTEDGTLLTMGGGGTKASGDASHAEGSSTVAQGKFSHAEGYGTLARGEASHASGSGEQQQCGTGTGASGSTTFTFASTPSKSVSVGDHLIFVRPDGMSRERNVVSVTSATQYVLDDDLDDNVNYTVYKLAYTIATGKVSRSVGFNTSATGDYSSAEGHKTTASGIYSHAEGRNTAASNHASHAEGDASKATSYYSHAEGYGTTASGTAAHAEGYSTTSSGKYSHVEGLGTTASSEAQHVQGKYNVVDTSNTYAHIIGNGSSTTPSNAHTIDWQGNAWFAGAIDAEDAATTLANLGAAPNNHTHTEYAPAGYGYGGAMTMFNNQDGTFESTLNELLKDMPNYGSRKITFVDKVGLSTLPYEGTLWKYINDYACIYAVNYAGTKAIKYKQGGVWSDWEFQNPGMVTGVEYRTMDRINHKTVYKRRTSTGAIEYRLDGETTWKSETAVNPSAITINGISYDGSYPVEINVASSGGGSITETDPTVPAWAKAATKPTYTPSEIGAVPTSRTVNGKALSSNITLSASDVGAASTDAATQSSAGLMSAADKKKLDGIATGANNYTYTLPNATSSTLGGVKIGSNITVSSGTISLTKANVTSALGYTPSASSGMNRELGSSNNTEFVKEGTTTSVAFPVNAGVKISPKGNSSKIYIVTIGLATDTSTKTSLTFDYMAVQNLGDDSGQVTLYAYLPNVSNPKLVSVTMKIVNNVVTFYSTDCKILHIGGYY